MICGSFSCLGYFLLSLILLLLSIHAAFIMTADVAMMLNSMDIDHTMVEAKQ